MKPAPRNHLLQDAWGELEAAAIAFQRGGVTDKLAVSRLATAAVEYAKARNLVAITTPGPQRPVSSDRPLPYGREKGVQLRNATSASLRWMHNSVSDRLEGRPQYRADNVALLDAIAHELRFRGEPLEAENG